MPSTDRKFLDSHDLVPDQPFAVYDKVTGGIISAGLIISRVTNTEQHWCYRILTKDEVVEGSFEPYINELDERYYLLDGAYWEANLEELENLPRVPRIPVG